MSWPYEVGAEKAGTRVYIEVVVSFCHNVSTPTEFERSLQGSDKNPQCLHDLKAAGEFRVFFCIISKSISRHF